MWVIGLRTRREHLSPVKAWLLVLVVATIHGHAVLARRHVVVGQLLVETGLHRVLDIAAVTLLEVASAGVAGHARDAAPVLAVAILHPVKTAGAGQLVLVVGEVGHALGHLGHHAERLHDAISRHVVHAIEVVQVSVILANSGRLLLGGGILLDVSLGVRQVGGTAGVSAADRALLEVTLENVASGERIAAQDTHVRAVARV